MFMAIAFPILFCTDVNIYGTISPERILFYFVVISGTFVLGIIESVVTKKHPLLRIPLRVVGCFTFLGGFLSFFAGDQTFVVLVLGLGCIFGFFAGERAGYKNFTEMFPTTSLGIYAGAAVASVFFVQIGGDPAIKADATEIIVIALEIEFVAAAILANQSGIFQKANMRRETKSSLPKGLASYNITLILLLLIPAVLLTMFRKQVSWLLSAIFRIISSALIWLIEFFATLGAPEEQPEEPNFSVEDLLGNGESNETANNIFFILVFVAAAVILFLLRKKIVKSIRALIGKIAAFLNRRPQESDELGFVDVFEDYAGTKKEKAVPDRLRDIKKEYRAASDPRKKYRTGYRILLMRIKERNKELVPSDTTSVQSERGAGLFGYDELSAVARVYDGIRYRNAVPVPEQLARLDELVNKQ